MPYSSRYVCVKCRRAFKRPNFGPPHSPCPDCGDAAVLLHPSFKAPPRSNVKQWKKVAFLIEHGVRFVPLWDAEKNQPIRYPANLREAKQWVAWWQTLPAARPGPAAPSPDRASKARDK